MSIQDYVVNNDKFEPDKEGLSKYDFPCYCCKYLHKDNMIRPDTEEPCSKCGHNIASESD